jgi:hypothetical protein
MVILSEQEFKKADDATRDAAKTQYHKMLLEYCVEAKKLFAQKVDDLVNYKIKIPDDNAIAILGCPYTIGDISKFPDSTTSQPSTPTNSTPNPIPSTSLTPKKSGLLTNISSGLDILNNAFSTKQVIQPAQINPTVKTADPRKLPILSHYNEDEIIKIINSDKLELTIDVDDYIKKFSYQGFNPKVVITSLLAVESDEDKLYEDMQTFITFLLLRGTNLSKQLKKTETAAADIVANIRKKYSIKDKAPVGSSVLTPGRILSALPQVSSNLAAKGAIRDPTKGTYNLDKKYRFLQGCCIVPEANYQDWINWAVEYDTIINKTPDQEKVKSFAKLSRDNFAMMMKK